MKKILAAFTVSVVGLLMACSTVSLKAEAESYVPLLHSVLAKDENEIITFKSLEWVCSETERENYYMLDCTYLIQYDSASSRDLYAIGYAIKDSFGSVHVEISNQEETTYIEYYEGLMSDYQTIEDNPDLLEGRNTVIDKGMLTEEALSELLN